MRSEEAITVVSGAAGSDEWPASLVCAGVLLVALAATVAQCVKYRWRRKYVAHVDTTSVSGSVREAQPAKAPGSDTLETPGTSAAQLSSYEHVPVVAPYQKHTSCSIELVARSESVADTADLLTRVCDIMRGSIRGDHTLDKHSIRRGLHAVAVNGIAVGGPRSTILFYPEDRRRARHIRLYERKGMSQLLPLVIENVDAHVHRHAGCAVHVPAHLYLNRVTTLDDVLAQCHTVVQLTAEATTIWRQLTQFVAMLHKRHIVVRDVCRCNVVRAATGAAMVWTLLELSSVMRPASRSSSLTAATCPPEAAEDFHASGSAEITCAFDMWQLGMLMYEVHRGAPYWAHHRSDAAVLECLLDSERPLPHEQWPVQPAVVQALIARTLARDATQRATAAQLEVLLRTDLTRDLPNQTLNPNEVELQAAASTADIVLT